MAFDIIVYLTAENLDQSYIGWLREAGHRLKSASSEAQLIQMVIDSGPTLVLCNPNSTLENHPEFWDAGAFSTIIVSGNPSEEEATRYFKLGVSHYMTPPTLKGPFLNLIQWFAKYRHMEQSVQEAHHRQQSAERLAEIGMMASNIAHDISNPMAVISGKAKVMKIKQAKGALGEEEIEASIEKILGMSQHIVKIINGLRKLARKSRPEKEQFIFKDTLFDALDLVQELAEKSKIKIEAPPIDGNHKIFGDQVEFTRVLVNLMNNAIYEIKSQEQPWLKVEFDSCDNWLKIRIIDSGHGIPHDIQEKIFGSFFTTKPVGQGTGLGLSTAKEIIHNHQGNLRIDNNHPNTCFEIVLPQAHLAEKRLRPKVLIMEDDPDILEVLSDMLSEAFTVETRHDTDIECYKRYSHIDIFIVDLHIAPVSGLDVIKNIKKIPTLTDKPILICTGTNEPDTLKTIEDLGVKVLYKPFFQEEIVTYLNNLISD